ncbi:choline BCCT transporter BetT [Microbacterium halotolerans]|uniref:choline BCCT transporter BetT n=1 Tax=Microbacterium halotolerans TaxID=246613 RepID=UPI000E6AC576|nr:choline BCCT transporter BetT [Microbacterium halotolerans]
MNATADSTEPAPSISPASRSRTKVNRPVFWISAVIVLAVGIWTLVSSANASDTIGVAVGWISTWFGPWYFLISAAVLVFVIIVAVSRAGNIRLGPDHSKPQFGLLTWSAMLFAAGIGTDLMYYAVAEPATQFLGPPVGEGGTTEAAREAVVWTMFHYGHIGWAMYALMGLALAYFHYRRGRPLSIRSALESLLGDRVWGRWGHVIDIAAIMGTVFGVAVTLGIGVSMLSRGLSGLTGLPDDLVLKIALIVISVVMATLSAVSGVAKGVRRLSEIQAILALVLLAFILITGNTSFLLNGLVMNLGDYIASLPAMTLDTMAFEAPTEWMNLWTLFFWAWWIAWAPFVGLFLARISRGRTIRQFVVGTMSIPFVYMMLWVSIFGNSTLEIIRGGGESGETMADLGVNDATGSLFYMLEQFPLAPATIGLALVTGMLFFVTSADSGALVLAKLSVDPKASGDDAPSWLRIVWSVLVGLVTLGMLVAGGIWALQQATMVMGLPFSFVILGVMIAFWKSLRSESRKQDTTRMALPSRLAGRSSEWQKRLRQLLSFPGARQTRRFIDQTCRPALTEVAAELDERGITTQFTEQTNGGDGLPSLRLVVLHGDEEDFRYELVPTQTPVPSYAGVDQSDATYYRMQVRFTEGAQGYDVEGWTKDQLIDDVLDAYELHLMYLQSTAAPAVEDPDEENAQ